MSDKIPDDKIPDRVFPLDKIPNDITPHDKISDDKIPEKDDKIPNKIQTKSQSNPTNFFSTNLNTILVCSHPN